MPKAKEQPKVSKKRDDDFVITLTGRTCTECGQPFDWHDSDPPHAVPADDDDDEDGLGDPGCPGFRE